MKEDFSTPDWCEKTCDVGSKKVEEATHEMNNARWEK